MQRYLQDYETVTECGPGATIRNAYQFGILEDGDSYMDMLRDRNLIAHTYKESVSIEIHKRIVENHICTLKEFIEKFNNKIAV